MRNGEALGLGGNSRILIISVERPPLHPGWTAVYASAPKEGVKFPKLYLWGKGRGDEPVPITTGEVWICNRRVAGMSSSEIKKREDIGAPDLNDPAKISAWVDDVRKKLGI
jgi:hypothetical protein